MTPPAAAATTGRTLPRTVAPRAPRRTSGPAARPRRGEDARRAPARDPFAIRAIERTIRLADSKFLDRLIRGRLWIPLVAAGLMGIVFMQVSMLKLNAGIGRAVQSAATLERQNATMRAQVSGMVAGSKIEATAEQLGMVAPAASTTPSYVTAGGAALASAAAKHMTAPDPDAIARAKAAATGIVPATTGATGLAPATSTPAAGVAASGVAGGTGTAATATSGASSTGASGVAGGTGTAASGMAGGTGTAPTGAGTSGVAGGTGTPQTGTSGAASTAASGAAGTAASGAAGTAAGTAASGTAASGAAGTAAGTTAAGTSGVAAPQTSTSGGAAAPTAG